MPALHSFKSNIDFAALVINSHMFKLPCGEKKKIVLPLEWCKMLICISSKIIIFYLKHGQFERNRLLSALFPGL